LRTLKKKVIGFLWAAWFALGHYWLSVIVFNNTAEQGLIVATIWNLALIIFFLVLEKAEHHFAHKLKAKYKDNEKKPNIFMKMVIAYLSGVSFKTALYLFHIYILVCSAINAADPEFFSEGFSAYLLTVEYGILVLVAADSFLNQLFKEVAKK